MHRRCNPNGVEVREVIKDLNGVEVQERSKTDRDGVHRRKKSVMHPRTALLPFGIKVQRCSGNTHTFAYEINPSAYRSSKKRKCDAPHNASLT